MTGVGTRAIATLAAAAFVAALLAACGGSNSSTSSSTSAESTSGGGPAHEKNAKDSQDGNRAEQQNRSDGKGSGGGESGEVSTPLEVSGGGSAQFRSKGGDNSIQEFGEESDESELEEAAEALHGFYVARAEEDWGRACSYLAGSLVEQLEQLAKQAPRLKGKPCPPVLRAFTRPLPIPVRRETTVVDAGSLRTEGDQSFLIYRGEGGLVYAMPMKEEDGEWKVGLLAPTPLG